MRPGDVFIFYLTLAVIILALVLVALPTLVYGPKKSSKR